MCTLDVALNIEDTKIRSGKTPPEEATLFPPKN